MKERSFQVQQSMSRKCKVILNFSSSRIHIGYNACLKLQWIFTLATSNSSTPGGLGGHRCLGSLLSWMALPKQRTNPVAKRRKRETKDLIIMKKQNLNSNWLELWDKGCTYVLCSSSFWRESDVHNYIRWTYIRCLSNNFAWAKQWINVLGKLSGKTVLKPMKGSVTFAYNKNINIVCSSFVYMIHYNKGIFYSYDFGSFGVQ